MDEVIERVDQARHRLAMQRWVHRAVRCVFWAMLVALVAVAVPKLFAFPSLPEGWNWQTWNMAWLGGGVAVGLLAATVGGFLRPVSREEAAIELDSRYGLRERVASSLLIEELEGASEAGAALQHDAQRIVQKVEVAERFGVGLGRRAWLPLVPALLAFCLIAFVGNQTAQSSTDSNDAVAENKEEVKKAIEKARKKLQERQKKAAEKGLADASGLLKEIEKGTKDLAKLANSDKTKAIVKLNDLAKRLEKRRAKLGGADALRKQLNNMKDLGGGPAKKAAEAMKQGDWQKAMDEMAKMQQDLASGKASPEMQKQLAAQLGKMQQKLAQAVQQQKQQKEDLQKQIAAALRNGDLAKAGQLQQKLDQMQQQAPQMQQLAKMAQKMGQAQQALQQGDAQQAAAAMQQMQQQLAEMQQQAQAMEMLDGAMTDIEMAKASCMGMQPMPPGQMARMMNGMGGGAQGKKPGGMGMGEGQGRGPRPDEKNPTNFRNTNVKQNVGRGASTFGGLVRGPSIKGQVTESVKQELTTTNVTPADPLTSERLPKSRREHAEEYFRKLRDEL